MILPLKARFILTAFDVADKPNCGHNSNCRSHSSRKVTIFSPISEILNYTDP